MSESRSAANPQRTSPLPRRDVEADAARIGPYLGGVAEPFRTPELLARLRDLPMWLASASTVTVAGGRNRHLRVAGLLGANGPDVVVKSFGRLSLVKDLRDRRRGSKAKRSFVAAEHLVRHGVGTPAPVAWLERWHRGRLHESHYIALWQPGVQTLREALTTLFHEHPDAERFVDLLAEVASGVRAMHDAGFVHNDLGSTNVLLTPDGAGRWRGFQVVDLNRGRIRPAPLDLRERARDHARLGLPSHLLQIYAKLYWRARPSPDAARWQRFYLRLHRWRVQSRSLRHPLRERRLKRLAQRDGASRRYPAAREMWIWDERVAQPLNAMLSEERRRHYPASRFLRMAGDTLRAANSVWREYRAVVATAFTQPVAMQGRIGMAVDPAPGMQAAELEWLAGLGRIPAFVRFYHHEDAARRDDRVTLVQALHAAGHPVAIALVQDRTAVREPGRWRGFCSDILDQVAPVVDSVEFGHSLNRVKWGIWSLDDVRALFDVLPALAERHPDVRWLGPPTIDFDYPFALSALREWPSSVRLAALSQHLYVDRRGAPESPQNGFALVEKLALARAIARTAPNCDDRVVVTEVNWPLEHTAPWSPIGPPFIFPSQGADNSGNTEDEYADYMLRYYALALASGLAERVYWWRLVAHGYGLVDDIDRTALRPRPAYRMLQRFIELLGDATFVRAQLPPRSGARAGRHRLEFLRPDGETVVMTYAKGAALPFPADEAFAFAEDASGRALGARPDQLTGRPVYLRHARLHGTTAR